MLEEVDGTVVGKDRLVRKVVGMGMGICFTNVRFRRHIRRYFVLSSTRQCGMRIKLENSFSVTPACDWST